MTELPTDKSVNEADAQAAPGSVTEPFEVTDAQLISLASLRTSMVINFLVEQHGIERSRLYTCRETIESIDEQPPRVEISL